MKRTATIVSMACLFLALENPAFALLAGASPDTPVARIDANSATSPWAGVGSISINGNTFSGVLIAPGYVLTAGHVAYGVAPESITVNLNAGSDLTYQLAASAVYTPATYHGFDNANLANDLAIIKLSTPAPAGIPSYDIYRAQLAPGSTLTLVGYGASGSGSTGVSVGASASVKRLGQNNADYFLRDANGNESVYYYDFDGPLPTSNVMGGDTLGNMLETTVATGDSGSPAFYTDANGHVYLAGINTFSALFSPGQTAGTFGTGGGGMVLSDYVQWIDSVTAPIPEPEPFPMLMSGLGLLAWTIMRHTTTKTPTKTLQVL